MKRFDTGPRLFFFFFFFFFFFRTASRFYFFLLASPSRSPSPPAHAETRAAAVPARASASTSGSTNRCRSIWHSSTRRASKSGSGTTSTSKPVILVLAYYRCPCSAPGAQRAGAAPCSISARRRPRLRRPHRQLRSRETPELAAAKKKRYLEHYGRPGRGRLAFPHRRAGLHQRADRRRRLPLHLRRRAMTSSPTPAASWC